jgi:thermitase
MTFVTIGQSRNIAYVLPVRLLRHALCLLLLTAPVAHAADALPGRVIVGFEQGAEQNRILERAGARVVRRLGSIRAAAVAPRDGGSLQALRRALRAEGRVRYVEPDWFLDASRTPNDPDYGEQYALGARGAAAAGAPAAWDTATSCANVAILDSGMQYGHPDLKDNVWHNADEVKSNGKDDDKNGYVDDYYGVDLVDGSGSGADENGHGTHVAGIIGGRGNNGTGVSGLCWSVHMIPIKFLNSRGRGATSGAIEGIQYAMKQGVRVLNGSFGSDAKSQALEDAVDKAREKGLLLVFAAGNDGANVENAPIYPASYTDNNILAVASITSAGALASYSNYGKTSVDLAAPGDKIHSTYPSSTYKDLSGTSMASPLVAATAALLRKRDTSLTYAELRTAIRSHTKANDKLAGKVATGGQLDVAAALAAVD